MNTTSRNLPRFLPTLTEVVQAPGSAGAPATAAPDLEDLAQFVMQRVDPVLQRRLGEEADAMVRAWMTEQLPTLRLSLREELLNVVRQAVSEAMTPGANGAKK